MKKLKDLIERYRYTSLCLFGFTAFLISAATGYTFIALAAAALVLVSGKYAGEELKE